MLRSIFPLLFLVLSASVSQSQTSEPDVIPFRNHSLPVDDRVNDLISRLTLEEKVLQMQNSAPAIPRLGIPEYNWWNECLHGVARNGIATVFPQAIGMAATWDPALIGREADVISTEARAKHHENERNGERGIYQGLTFWSPNINIFRDPRWGRGQETYGEDPYLTGRIGVAFVKGLQGNDPKYFKVISTAKHFAVHSGPESTRHQFDAWCSEKDLFESYLPAFETLIREGKAYSVMCAYNRLENQPCCANDFLLDEILRKKWGFEGYVTSDCGAIWDIYNGHKLQPDDVRSSVLGVKAGCDLTCGTEYKSLVDAVNNGYIDESEIDVSLKRLLKARFLLGMFDPEALVPYSQIPFSENNTEEHRHLARKVAQESMVLLKNNNILPLKAEMQKLAVIGPYADKVNILLGNYNGTPSSPVTFLQGIRNKTGKGIRVEFARGVMALEDSFRFDSTKLQWINVIDDDSEKEMMDEALRVAENSDVVIFCGGISSDLEGEEMPVKIDGFSGGDRTSLDLPDEQRKLLKKIHGTGKPVILVLTGGSALSIPWEKENLQAILMVWYPGEEGGNALADILFGDYNPAGRLPVTFYRSVDDLPPFENYSMAGRTYRYFKGDPLFPFGFGLSYTTFDYENCRLDKRVYSVSDTVRLRVKLKNKGTKEGDEVIEVYSEMRGSKYERPLKSLVGFSRVHLSMGEDKIADIPIPVSSLRIYDPSGKDYFVEPGKYMLNIGSSSGDYRLQSQMEVSGTK
jgi:beta-glucosidase